MPKLKNNKGSKKRFKKINKNTFKHRSANRAHINTKMTTKRKRHLRKNNIVSKADVNTIKQQLPY